MRITTLIDYWDDGVLTFDPEKVVSRLKDYFPQLTTDLKDYSMNELENFIQNTENKVEEPTRSRVIESMKGKNRRNGPAFRFKVILSNNDKIDGVATRYRVEFISKSDFDVQTENSIISFLKSLKYGQIVSNQQTANFCKVSHPNSNQWLLNQD